MLRRAIAIAALCSAPFTAHAFEALLKIDAAASFVDQISPGTAGIYRLPAGGEIRFVFGERQGDVVPVSIPLGGLRVGTLDGDGVPALRIRLAAPASGTLAVSGANAGALQVDAAVVAETVVGPKTVTYALRFSTASMPLMDFRTGSTSTTGRTICCPGRAAGSERRRRLPCPRAAP